MKLETVKALLDKYNISIKKVYGQNFLMDDNIISSIVDKSEVDKTTGVIEIGPGLGFLTKEIIKHAGHTLCYEIDEDMKRVLDNEYNNIPNLTILLKDFLKCNIEEDIKKYLSGMDKIYVISNLPYYITTPILLKIFEESSSITKLTCMMQKEVAQRLCGTPSTKDYNALSVLVQYYTNAKIIINVPSQVFYPEPDVDSAVVLMEYSNKAQGQAINEAYFKKFNRAIFSQRRKTLANNLKSSMGLNKETIEKVLNNNHISLTIRAEALTVKDIIHLADEFYKETHL